MDGEGDVKVLGTVVSPFALRVRMALYLKGMSYEYLEQDLFDKGELLVASNPVHKKVPVLIHGGKPVCESLAIVQYVDEFWSGAASILPADPYDRAIALLGSVCRRQGVPCVDRHPARRDGGGER
ncbi:hypothetical protein ACQ4PT_040156 [Festuca glaucescens]